MLYHMFNTLKTLLKTDVVITELLISLISTVIGGISLISIEDPVTYLINSYFLDVVFLSCGTTQLLLLLLPEISPEINRFAKKVNSFFSALCWSIADILLLTNSCIVTGFILLPIVLFAWLVFWKNV